MGTRFIVASLAAVLPLAPAFGSEVHEMRIPAERTSLYAREVGRGRPLVVLHGGPDFDHRYLLPEMDRLSDAFRLIYYDQRGRGDSAKQVQPDDVTLLSDVEDLERVRQFFHLESMVLLGHSWGAVLALEYALRHPERVSHLILMNPAPASATDLAEFRRVYAKKLGADLDRQRAIQASTAYQQGDPEAVTERYRLHFRHAVNRAEDYERLMARMRAAFIHQGREGILEARAVEDRLMRDTWHSEGYDLLPRLRTLKIPTLVIAGDHDFFPPDVPGHAAGAIPDARLVTLRGCGHFAYLECPGKVRKALQDFLPR
ncbi:MAG: alpha/beta fold hydrolase [Myxococcaceae bacterium]